MYTKFIQKSQHSYDKIKIYRGLSTDPILQELVLRDGPFNAIYVDGGHDYQTVCSDIKFAASILADGGLLIMDDASSLLNINHHNDRTVGHEDVALAIKDKLDTSFEFRHLFACGHNRIWRKETRNVPKIHLLIDYYKNPRPERSAEIDFCFNENINTKEFDFIHIFKSSDLPDTEIPKNVIINEVNTRLTYQYYFEYAKNNIPSDDIVVLSNSDIFFDESILKTKDIDLSDKVLALTRFCPYLGHWTNDNNILIPYHSHDRSQDVWVWKNPLKYTGDDFNFGIGIIGCDNKLAFQLHKHGYQVWNPSFSIITYHKHAERNDSSDQGPANKRLPGTYMFVNACFLENINKANYKKYIYVNKIIGTK